MSKFFTRPSGLLLAWVWPTVIFGEMTQPSPTLPPAVAAHSSDGEALPRPLMASRFSALGRKSPFTLASTTEENADFAKDLILAGYFRMDGQDYVMVANRTQPARLMVGTKASPAAQGMVLVKVERDPSGDPTKLRAQIRKGTETATLRYEASAGAGGQPNPVPVAPGQPTLPGQPTVGQTAPGAPGPTPGANPPVIRRRVVPIPPVPAR